MGIPYSKQINAAFDEVTPLVAAGFDVLRTSRNISILLAAIQVFSVLLLGLVLLTLIALLISVNPDLEYERQVLVTPAVRWIAQRAIGAKWLRLAVWAVLIGSGVGTLGGWLMTRDTKVVIEEESDVDEAGTQTGEDGDARSRSRTGKGKE